MPRIDPVVTELSDAERDLDSAGTRLEMLKPHVNIRTLRKISRLAAMCLLMKEEIRDLLRFAPDDLRRD